MTVGPGIGMPQARVSMHSDAWLLRGISSIPGRLLLEHGHIRFVAASSGTAWPWQLRKLARQLATTWPGDGDGRAHDAELFRWPLAAVRAWAPWYYFSGGIRLAHAGQVLRFSFGRPVDADARGEELDVYREVDRMRATGLQWLAVLSQAGMRRGHAEGPPRRRLAPLACFSFSALVPTAAYLGMFLWLGADARQWPLVLMVLWLGVLCGWTLPARWAITPMRAAMMALAGLSIGWLFAVVITWGFALQGAWVLPVYALACHQGRRLGMRRGL